MESARKVTPEVLRKIYRDTVDELYGYISRRTGADRELSEDVVQEAYIRALDNWSAQGVPEQPVAWLKTVARNLLLSHYRKSRPRAVADPQDMSEVEFSTDPATAAAVHQALGVLKTEQACLIESFHFEGKAVKEIAAEMEISERAVEGRLRRAREALRRFFKPGSRRKGR